MILAKVGDAARPVVSVIVNCRNGERFLGAALDSALRQTFGSLEVVLWDNASTDSTPEIGMRYARDAGVRYFRSDRSAPLGEARNEAIAKARGLYLAFLDADDVWRPEYLARVVPLLENGSAHGVVYSDAYRITEEGEIVGRFSDDARFLRGHCFWDLLAENFVSAFSAVVIRASSWRAAGGFRPEYEICEEYELLLRIARRESFEFVPEPLVEYRWHGANASRQQRLRTQENLKILREWEALLRQDGEVARQPLRTRATYLALRAVLDAWEGGSRGELVRALRELSRSHPGTLVRVLYTSVVQRRIARRLREVNWQVRRLAAR